jgi:prevent-host-death family protein
MARKLSAVQAKSQLADCLRKAESGEPVIITRHGKPVAALVSVDRVALPKRKATRAGAGLAGLAGGWKGSEDLVKTLGKIRRTRPGRPIALD